jgi:AraC family L-rhamnose operon regulatory protein RhaS
MRMVLSGKRRRVEPARVAVPERGVRIIESHHAPDFEMEMGRWPFRKICWIVTGSGRLQTEERAVSIRKDDFLLLPSDWAHCFRDSSREPLTLVVLCISESFFHAPDAEFETLWRGALGSQGPGMPLCGRSGFHQHSLVDIFRLAMRESESRQTGWQAALGAAVTSLLVYFNRGYCHPRREHVENSRQTVEGSIDYIVSHLQEALQIEDIARRCQLSPRRYTDLFKEITGQTFSHFLRRKRIAFACRRLDETGHIVYACHESGFNDVTYFYRVFKQELGLTPGEYLQAGKPSPRRKAHNPDVDRDSDTAASPRD